MAKVNYKAGDKVRCINLDGWVASTTCKVGDIYTTCKVGDIYTIQVCNKNERLSIKLQEDVNNLFLDGRSFELVKEENVPKNPNVKIINTFVPSWAKWMAMSKSGVWHVYADKPETSNKCWSATEGSSLVTVGRCQPRDIEVDWKETLHEI